MSNTEDAPPMTAVKLVSGDPGRHSDAILAIFNFPIVRPDQALTRRLLDGLRRL